MGRPPTRPARLGVAALAVSAAAVAALVAVVALAPRAPREGRTELVPVPHHALPDDTSGAGAPFVLAGGGSSTILKELSYNHAADRGAGRRHLREARAHGRHMARRRGRGAPGRAQKLEELDPDDPTYGKYVWRDPASLEQEENTFDTDEYDSTPHEWKGAGEPEENVFENMEEDGAKKAQGGAKQASLARVRAKAEKQAKQRAMTREEAVPDAAGQRRVIHEELKLQRATQQKKELEDKLLKRDNQLASVKKQLLAEKSRVAQVEREAQGHIWRRQHSPVNVLKTVYPQIKWKWHKNVEHLPSAIFDNLKAKPVLWHKYRPTPSHVLDYLSTKPVEWHQQEESYNALEGLPVENHEWHKQPEEVNVLNSLPDGTHQWRR